MTVMNTHFGDGGRKNVWGWVCDWAEAGSEQGEEGVGKKVESKF